MIETSFNPKQTPGPTPKGRRTILILIALICGVGAALIAHIILDQKITALEQAAQHASTKSIDNTDVIVARSTITPGTLLNKDNLTIRSTPKQWVPSYALTADEFPHINKKTSPHTLQVGDMVPRWLLEHTQQSASQHIVETTFLPTKKSEPKVMMLYGDDAINAIHPAPPP
jgi:Flp pilus assembly protein CpaB